MISAAATRCAPPFPGHSFHSPHFGGIPTAKLNPECGRGPSEPSPNLLISQDFRMSSPSGLGAAYAPTPTV